MKRHFSNISCALIMAIAAISCTKEVLLTQGKVVARKDVTASKGSFSIFVHTTGVWSAKALESWLHVPGDMFKDNYSLYISYDSNESSSMDRRFNRLGHVVICTHDGATADTLVVRQKGIEPFIAFDAENTVPAEGGECYIPVSTNLSGAQRSSIKCSCDASWVDSPAFGADCASICFKAGKGSGRSAVITMSFTDAWGIETSASCTIRQ